MTNQELMTQAIANMSTEEKAKSFHQCNARTL